MPQRTGETVTTTNLVSETTNAKLLDIGHLPVKHREGVLREFCSHQCRVIKPFVMANFRAGTQQLLQQRCRERRWQLRRSMRLRKGMAVFKGFGFLDIRSLNARARARLSSPTMQMHMCGRTSACICCSDAAISLWLMLLCHCYVSQTI